MKRVYMCGLFICLVGCGGAQGGTNACVGELRALIRTVDTTLYNFHVGLAREVCGPSWKPDQGPCPVSMSDKTVAKFIVIGNFLEEADRLVDQYATRAARMLSLVRELLAFVGLQLNVNWKAVDECLSAQ